MQAGFVSNRSGTLNRTEQYSQYVLMAYPQANGQPGSFVPPVEVSVFQAKESMEGTIVRWMHRIISNQQPFTFRLSQNIDSSSGKLQLCISDKAPFQQLAAQLKVVSQYISSSDCPEMIFSIQPRLSSMPPEQVLSGSFEVKEFLLLKKSHDFDNYKQVNVFALRP